MSIVSQLFDSKSVSSIIKKKLKNIKKCKVDTESIVSQLTTLLKDKYTINKSSSSEIYVKLDKKKNYKQVEEDVKDVIGTLVPDRSIDLMLLFNFIHNNNELIVRAKRYNG